VKVDWKPEFFIQAKVLKISIKFIVWIPPLKVAYQRSKRQGNNGEFRRRLF
jgi:hypothetical protein